MVITTEADLASRLGIDSVELAMGAQTMGGKKFMRAWILKDGPMRVLARGPNGKGILRSEDCFLAVYGESVHPAKSRAKK